MLKYTHEKEHSFVNTRIQALARQVTAGHEESAKELVKAVAVKPKVETVGKEKFHWHQWLSTQLLAGMQNSQDTESFAFLVSQTASLFGDQDLLLQANNILDKSERKDIQVDVNEDIAAYLGDGWDDLLGADNPPILTKRWLDMETPDRVEAFTDRHSSDESE